MWRNTLVVLTGLNGFIILLYRFKEKDKQILLYINQNSLKCLLTFTYLCFKNIINLTTTDIEENKVKIIFMNL